MTGIGENTLAQPVKPPLRERRACLAKLVKNRLTLTKIRTNNVQERANREIKRRYRSVQSFPSEASMMRLVCAVLAGEEGRWAAHRVAAPESAARASAPAPAPEPLEGERLEAVRLAAHEVIREVLDRHGVAE